MPCSPGTSVRGQSSSGHWVSEFLPPDIDFLLGRMFTFMDAVSSKPLTPKRKEPGFQERGF